MRILLQNIASISQIIQAVLVVISLGLIWYQIREAVRLEKSENTRALITFANDFDSKLIQNPDLTEIWYSYGKNIDSKGIVQEKRYRKLLVQRIAFHEYLYYQSRKKLLDEDMYRVWKHDLERVVKNHNLDVFKDDGGIDKIFPEDFGNYLKELYAKFRSDVNTMNKSQQVKEEIKSDEAERLWQHGLHEENAFNQRLNFFLILESFLLSIFAQIFTQNYSTYDQKLVLRIILSLGLSLTLVWAYVSARQKYCLDTVRKRTRELLPEYAETVKVRNKISWPLSNAFLLAYMVPGIFIVLWVVLQFIF